LITTWPDPAAPTILDVAQLPEPYMVNSVAQSPMQGLSMRYSFDDAAAVVASSFDDPKALGFVELVGHLFGEVMRLQPILRRVVQLELIAWIAPLG
jgi:hypothetical protein